MLLFFSNSIVELEAYEILLKNDDRKLVESDKYYLHLSMQNLVIYILSWRKIRLLGKSNTENSEADSSMESCFCWFPLKGFLDLDLEVFRCIGCDLVVTVTGLLVKASRNGYFCSWYCFLLGRGGGVIATPSGVRRLLCLASIGIWIIGAFGFSASMASSRGSVRLRSLGSSVLVSCGSNWICFFCCCGVCWYR